MTPVSERTRLYLGSYTSDGAEGAGIGLATAGPDRISVTDSVADMPDPSFLAGAPDGSVVYAVNERPHGRVTAMSVTEDGTLRELNSQPTLGAAPCHLSVHPGGGFVLTANYASGNLVVHPIGAGGALREPCHVVQHSGSGPNPDRQRGPHAHQVLPDPTGRHVLAVDLGTDTISVYEFDAGSGHLELRHELAQPAGGGPRHLAFAPSGDRAYLVNELACTVTEFGYDATDGLLEAGRTLSAVPTSDGITGLGAEIHVVDRFVLTSTRGHDSIAVFDTGERGDDFRLLGIHPCGVSTPRHFGVLPDGRTLVVAGLDSSTLRVFTVTDSGELTPLGDPVAAPSPACVLALS